MTIEGVCSRAGIDREAFDAAYADLEDCFAQVHQGEFERYQRGVLDAREGLTSWRDRLRATAYAMYRFIEDEKVWKFTFVEVRSAGERPLLLLGAQIEGVFDLVDEGRQEPDAPGSLTRATAESVGGGIFNQIYAAAGQGGPLPPERQIVPQLMYAVVLPYLGPEVAQEELTMPPPEGS